MMAGMPSWMRRGLKTLARLIGFPLALLAAVVALSFVVHTVSVRWPHRVRADASSFHVEGRYYWIDLAGVEGIALRDGHLLVTGYAFTSWRPSRLFQGTAAEVVRSLPGTYSDAVPSPTWALTGRDYVENGCRYTFRRARSGQTLSIELPCGSADLHYGVLRAADDTVMIVFASGDWKVGPESYYGYVIVRPSR